PDIRTVLHDETGWAGHRAGSRNCPFHRRHTSRGNAHLRQRSRPRHHVYSAVAASIPGRRCRLLKKRILFVDDEPRVLEGLQDLLERYRSKWEMVFAGNGEASLAEFKKSPFDVIVTDLRMPSMDGL